MMKIEELKGDCKTPEQMGRRLAGMAWRADRSEYPIGGAYITMAGEILKQPEFTEWNPIWQWARDEYIRGYGFEGAAFKPMHGYKIYALHTNVLLVASVNFSCGEYATYINACPGENHLNEFLSIAEHGDKVEKRLSDLYFPYLNQPFRWRP